MLHPDTSTTTFKLITPHHKSSWRGLQGNNFTIQDPVLTKLILLYEKHGRRLLLTSEGSKVQELFITDKGQSFMGPHGVDYGAVGQWFKAFQATYKPPFPMEMAKPSQMRRVFANHVMKNQDVGTGPTLDQAAMMMGNTKRTLQNVRKRHTFLIALACINV